MTGTAEASAGDWRPGTAVGRWSTLGPYYAMFPVDFVRRTVVALCPEGDGVLDPFCGRGTVPYVARVTGRPSLGVDVNPVAWVFASAKTDPARDTAPLLQRLRDVASCATAEDTAPENEFQKWAWAPAVLGFLRSARRNLDWRGKRDDRTLMAIILVHLHGKVGNAVSNQMRQSKSMGPEYAVGWWAARALRPPELDPLAYFSSKIEWRYRHGIPDGAAARVVLGDARKVLPRARSQYGLMLTSPPYYGVTNYRLDNWIRLWMLGEGALPEYEISQRFCNQANYEQLLAHTFGACARLLTEEAAVYVRTDSRPFTRNLTASIISEIWPDRNILKRADRVARSQTHLFGPADEMPGETDLLALGPAAKIPAGFDPVPAAWLDRGYVRDWDKGLGKAA